LRDSFAWGTSLGLRQAENFAQVMPSQIPISHVLVECRQTGMSQQQVGLDEESLIERGRRLSFAQPSQKRQMSRPDTLARVVCQPQVDLSQNQVGVRI